MTKWAFCDGPCLSPIKERSSLDARAVHHPAECEIYHWVGWQINACRHKDESTAISFIFYVDVQHAVMFNTRLWDPLHQIRGDLSPQLKQSNLLSQTSAVNHPEDLNPHECQTQSMLGRKWGACYYHNNWSQMGNTRVPKRCIFQCDYLTIPPF